MNCKITNEIKMRKFIEKNIDRELTDDEFNDWLYYLKETADYIQINGEKHIQEEASLTLELEENDYELFAKFSQVVENNEIIYLIDLD
jgi:hypothetical protein